jgi:phenylacetate-CoA ligase
MSARGIIGFWLIDLARRTVVLGTLRRLDAEQWLSPETLAAHSRMQVVAHFEEVRKHVPYYRNFSRFEDVPVTTKDVVRASVDVFLNRTIPEADWVRKKTGGSTGEPFVYYTSRLSQSFLWAGILLAWKSAGYTLGEPVGFVAGSSVFGDQSWKQKLYYRLMNVNLYSAFDMTESAMTLYLKSMQRRKIRLLYGYGSAIQRLSQHARASKIEIPSLRACVTTAEVLTAVMRDDIETGFGCPVFDQYGVNDAGVSAFECDRHRGLHLIVSRCFYEMTASGGLLSTDVTNDVMPLLRYDTGDRVRLSSIRCTCGRGYPLIESVDGRANDGVVAEDGNWVHSEFFTHMFREEQGIRKFQIVQRADRAIEIRIAGKIPADVEQFEAALHRRLGNLEIVWTNASDFVLTSAGKMRFVVSMVPQGEVAQASMSSIVKRGDR